MSTKKYESKYELGYSKLKKKYLRF